MDIKVPSMGESIVEGTISRWLKKSGETVQVDEPVLELETEKATSELPAPAAGVLEIVIPEGKTVEVGSVVGRIDEKSPATKSAEPGPEKGDGAKKADGAKKTEEPAKLAAAKKAAETPHEKEPAESAADAGSERDPALSPSVRRLVREQQVDVRDVHGTGRDGRITRDDVLAFLSKRQTQPAPPADAGGSPAPAPAPPADAGGSPGRSATRQRMSAIRRRIADRLVEAQNTAAILTTFNEADMSAVLELRARFKEAFQKKHGIGLGFMSFFVKAAVESLKAIPVLNARIEDDEIVTPQYHDIGVAVSTDKGLMVPVLRDADRLSFADIERRIAELADTARAGKIGIQDLQGGTFTITNGGVFGSLLSTPILNPPQSGILGMHAIQKRPVALNDQVVIRPMMYLALSYDHRLVDGREAVLFLVHLKECIENPDRLLLEI